MSDWLNDRVQKFNSAGILLMSWGGPGSNDGRFQDPAGIAVDADGNVYVGRRESQKIGP